MGNSNGNRLWAAGGLGLLALLGSMAIPFALGYGIGLVPKSPEIVLGVLIISGVAALIASLTIVAVAIAALGYSDKTQALSLPPGSIRAVIALSLILIFAIISVFFFFSIKNGPNGGEASVRFGLQTLTIIGTLVTAVAAFYFGTKAVEAGSSATLKVYKQTLEQDPDNDNDGSGGKTLTSGPSPNKDNDDAEAKTPTSGQGPNKDNDDAEGATQTSKTGSA